MYASSIPVILLALFSNTLLLQAQTFPDLKFFPLNINRSWPTDKINSQVIDKRGLIWFTSETAGLWRYDGNTLKQGIAPDSLSTTMHDLEVDGDNRLYISGGEGLIVYNTLTEEYKQFRHAAGDPKSIADDDKPNAFVDSKNRVWVTGQGVQRFDLSSETFTSYSTPELPANLPPGEFNRFEKMAEDAQGNIWVASAYGLYKIDTANQRVIPYFSGKYSWISGILFDSKNQCWVSTWGAGVMKFDPLSGKYTSFYGPASGSNITTNICEYQDVNFKRWICFCDPRSLILADPETGAYKHYYYGNQTAYPLLGTVNSLHVDKNNRLWICSEKGVFVIDNAQQQFREIALSAQSHLSEQEYGHPVFWFDYQDQIWLTLYYGNGIAAYNKDFRLLSRQSAFPPVSKSPFSRVVYQIRSDNHHNIWYLTDSGLVRQHGKTYQVFLPKKNFSHDDGCSFRSIVDAGNGKWWICSARYGMTIFDPEKERFENDYIPPEGIVLTVARPDRHGQIWVGSNAGLLTLDTGSKTYIPFHLHNPGLAGDKLLNKILDMAIGDKDQIWLATYAGLAVFDSKRREFSYPLSNESVGFNPAFQIIYGRNKMVWVLTEEKLIAYDAAKSLVKVFGSEFGIPRDIDFPAVFRESEDGKIWIGYRGGLLSFDPEKLFKIHPDQRSAIFISDVYGDGSRLRVDSETLHTDNPISNLRINFSFTNYSLSSRNILSFKLSRDGEKALWQTSNGQINLIDLLPGKYLLELKGENKTLSAPPVFATYKFQISPKWYQTLWLKTILMVFLAGIVALLVRARIRAIRQRAAIKQKIVETEMAALKAQMNPHFMFNCINSIDAFIYSNDKANATLYLNKYAKLLRNILDYSRENTVEFSKDIDTLKLYLELEELRHEGKFQTVFNIEDSLFDADLRIPPLIVQPFLENAILHGLKNKTENTGLLTIAIHQHPEGIEYIITDNGIGREAASRIVSGKTSSYGLSMSLDRIRLFNREERASVEIKDLSEFKSETGTFVRILLKVKH